MNILIVGAGNIGYRHSQKVHKINEVENIYFFDVDKKKYINIKKKIKSKKISFLNNLDLKKIKIDLAIIATTIEKRYFVLKNIIKQKPRLKNFILEKIVFPKKGHYLKTIELADKNKINIYINYPRSISPFYKKLKNLMFEKKITIKVKGSRWNMLSNLIHFLNLFEYLNHSNKIRFNKKENNNQIIDSSRVGYDDLLGRITFINSIGSKLILINLKNHTKPSIEIDSSEFNLSFSELDSLIYIEDKVKKKLKIFYKKKPLTLQSNMSYNIIKQFINNRYLNLPKINETLQSDFVFLDLVKFFEKQYKKKLYIT